MTVTELREALQKLESGGMGGLDVFLDVEGEYFYKLRRGIIEHELDPPEGEGREVLALSGGCRFEAIESPAFGDPPDLDQTIEEILQEEANRRPMA